jgi:hypothetical protein
MKPGRTFLSGTVAASAVALPLVVAAQPAFAEIVESHSDSFTATPQFEDLTGQTETCMILGSSSLLKVEGEADFHASAEHFSEDCTGHYRLELSYRDPAGRTVQVAVGDGFDPTPGTNSIGWSTDHVGGDLVVRHSITFSNCASNCTWAFTTRPK